MNNKIIEKYTVAIKSRINNAEKPISKLKDRAVEILILNKKKELKIKTNEKSLRDLAQGTPGADAPLAPAQPTAASRQLPSCQTPGHADGNGTIT